MKQRLVAIMFADAAGYSKLMRRDEHKAIKSIRYHLTRIRFLIAEHGGEDRGGAGDSLLATFPDARSAIRCAVAIQTNPDPLSGIFAIHFRIGVHIGKAMEIDRQLYGDSINVAARLESLAPEGGICVSRQFRDMLHSEKEYAFDRIGRPVLKNIGNEIEIFYLNGFGKADAARLRAARPPAEAAFANRQPSVVVLPFETVSVREDLALLAGGFAEEVIGFLTRFRALDVIAPCSSTRQRKLTEPELVNQLNVRFAISGSIRLGNRRICVDIRLLDKERQRVVWSEGYDRVFDDIFDVQHEIAECAAASMAVQIEEAERQLARARVPDSLDAYALQLQAREEVFCNEPDTCRRGLSLIERSLAISQDYARAYAVLARAHHLGWKYRWSNNPQASFQLAHEAAIRSTEIDRSDARGHAEVGFVALYRREHGRSLAAYERALKLNPSDADIISDYADSLKHSGKKDEAVSLFERAIRLNPMRSDRYRRELAHTYMVNRRFEDAIGTIHAMTDPTQSLRVLTASHAHLGRIDQAKYWAGILRKKYPDFTARNWATIVPDSNPADTELFVEGLERAGF